MMEKLKSFQNLPGIEKILLLKKLLGTDENNSEENAPNETENLNISLLLESFKEAYHKDIPEDKVKDEISKGKQKTLDNWLIKGGGVSSPKNQVKGSSKLSITNSYETSNTCNKSDVTSLFEPTLQIKHLDLVSVDTSRKRKTSESRICNKKSDISKVVSEVKEPNVLPRTTEKITKTNEKYNLRSKRKASEQPNVSKGGKSGIKHLKLADIQEDSPVITDWDVSNQISNFDDSSFRQSSKEYDKCDKSNSTENEKYNRRTKKKNLKSPQSAKINNIVDQSESSSQITHILSNNNKQLSSIASPSSPNYEAFCLLRRKCHEIGINVLDILQNKNIQTLLNDHKNVNGDAVVFIGCFETKTGETLPIVHSHESKAVLLKKLYELKK